MLRTHFQFAPQRMLSHKEELGSYVAVQTKSYEQALLNLPLMYIEYSEKLRSL
jgi:hypothetical protein